jgi:hypothetical protein
MLPHLVVVATLLSTLLALVAAQGPSPAPAWSMLRGRGDGKISGGASLATPVTASLPLRDLSWTTEQGAILLNGRHHFHMKGLSW